MEDCPRGRINVVTTVITGITRPSRQFVMPGYFFTDATLNTLRIALVFYPIQTGIAIG
jgi:hypothetical protein